MRPSVPTWVDLSMKDNAEFGVNCINICMADHISILELWREEEGKEEEGEELYVNFAQHKSA